MVHSDKMSSRNDQDEDLFNELVKSLISLNCPLITRHELWWMEELLLKPGKPRTDLLLWILSRLTNSAQPADDNDCTTASTTSAVNYKLPENDEGILEFLNQSAVLCADPSDNLRFVQGTMKTHDQLQLWSLLIHALNNIDKHGTNLVVSAGYNTLNSIISMDNFLDAFRLTATLLPPDVKSEVNHKIGNRKVVDQPPSVAQKYPSVYDDALSLQLAEQVDLLKSVSENFLTIYNSDLKIKRAKNESGSNLMHIGPSTHVIQSKMSAWKQDMDSLLELQQRNAFEKSKQKTDEILDHVLKDKAYMCFQDLCQNELG